MFISTLSGGIINIHILQVRKLSTERLNNNLPEITQLVSGRPRFKPRQSPEPVLLTNEQYLLSQYGEMLKSDILEVMKIVLRPCYELNCVPPKM